MENKKIKHDNHLEMIELRSDEVQEILTRPPHHLVRYGISVICGAMLIVFIGSFIFRYPDIVQGDVVITTENPPVWLVAKSTGKIKDLLCTDKQKVRQGEVLAVIENSATTADVLKINRLLSTIYISESEFAIPKELLLQSFELGEMQSSYSAFAKAAMNYANFRSLNLITQEKSSLEKQILARKSYAKSLQQQLEMKNRELQISKSAFERGKSLFGRKIISEADLETVEQSYISKQQDLQQLQTAISLEKVQSAQMDGSVTKLSIQYLQEKNLLFSELKSAHRELLSVLSNWQQKYLLSASQSGIVTFNTFWKTNQFITSGDKVFAIISQNPGHLIGKIKIPASGAGKLQIGQLVNIKIASYPYLEFGLLQGRTKNISLVSNNNFYAVEVDFPKGLHSTTNRELKFTGELNGIAEVITENRSIFDRIFAPIRYLVRKATD